jgi:hypothetical protein
MSLPPALDHADRGATVQHDTASESSLHPRRGGAAGAIARRPHEGAGPCIPFGGRRPGRDGLRAGRATLLPALILIVMGAALLAACGGSSTGASEPPSAAATPEPASSPLPGTPEEATVAFWRMVDADDYAGLTAAAAPGVTAAVTAATDDMAQATLLRVIRVERQPGGGAQVEADVRIVPSGQVTPWGEAGEHTLFVDLAEAPGGWLVTGWGTSP